MRFESDIHWSEGLFLQPHHFQQLQRSVHQHIRNERNLMLPYSCGLIDFEIDTDALNNSRVVLKHFSAVMPNGEELSMPGNTKISPLDVSQELHSHAQEIMVYLALPNWSELEANLTESVLDKRQFMCVETMVCDENSGDNEISLVRRRYNARLTTGERNNSDLELLPILRLRPQYRDDAEAILQVDTDYIAPYLQINNNCPLFAMISELNIQLRNRRDKILHDLSMGNYSTESLSGGNLYAVLQLQVLNSSERRLSSLLTTNRMTPFGLYLELQTLLGELSALQPMRESGNVGAYNHFDYAPQFMELMTNIRSLIMTEGLSTYMRIDFATSLDNHRRVLKLKDEHLVCADDYYLAVHCDANPRLVVEAVETGDNFKLVNPSAGTMRIRGIKLTEMRYPPRFLPALPDTVWFKLNRTESSRIWTEVCNERGMVLDWAEELFPNLEVSLFITVTSKKGA